MPQSLAPITRALAAIRRAGSTTWCWFAIYLLSAAVVIELVVLAGRAWLPALFDLALQKILPPHWHDTARDIADRLLAEDMAAIVATTGMGVGVVLVGITLFPIKEKLSASFERDAFPDLQSGNEPPLWVQGLQELQLLVFYAVFQTTSIYLGLQVSPVLGLAGATLGYFYLALAMALDHAAPLFQRRGVGLLRIIFLLVTRRPVSSIILGALFIAPACIAQIVAVGKTGIETAVMGVAGLEVLGMAFAALAATALSAELVADGSLERRHPPKWWSFTLTATCVTILAWQAVFFVWWGRTLHRSTLLTQCEWSLDWSSFDYRIHGEPAGDDRIAIIGVTAPLLIDNPSGHALDLAGARVEFTSDSSTIFGTASISASNAPSGLSRTQIELELRLPVSAALSSPRSVIEGGQFSLALDPPLSAQIRFPLN